MKSKGNSFFSDIKVLIQNCQGYEGKKEYNKRLIEKIKPTLVTWSELKLKESDAMCIQDEHRGYNSISQTPDMGIRDLKTRLEWRPTNGVAAMYEESWGEKVEKVKILKRSVAITFKINKLRLMYFGSYLPTNHHNDEGYKAALSEIEKEISGARAKYKKNFSYIIGGDLNIDQRHTEKRKATFLKFLTMIDGYHWIPQYPSFEHKHWKTKSYLDGVVISGNIAVVEIRNVTELEVEGNNSDHQPVLYTLRINTK